MITTIIDFLFLAFGLLPNKIDFEKVYKKAILLKNALKKMLKKLAKYIKGLFL